MLHLRRSLSQTQCTRATQKQVRLDLNQDLRTWKPELEYSNEQVQLELRENGFDEVPTVVPSSSVSLCSADLPADVLAVVTAWSSLPPAIKAGINAMIESTRAADAGGNSSVRSDAERRE